MGISEGQRRQTWTAKVKIRPLHCQNRVRRIFVISSPVRRQVTGQERGLLGAGKYSSGTKESIEGMLPGSEGSSAVSIPSNDRTSAHGLMLKPEHLEKNFLEE